MSWTPPMETQYQNHSVPYNSIGSFVDFFGGLTYDHVNYIFAGANYGQGIPLYKKNILSPKLHPIFARVDNAYPTMNTSVSKFMVSELESFSDYEYEDICVADYHTPENDEYSIPSDNPSVSVDDQSTMHQEGNLSSTSHAPPVECPRNHQDARDFEVVWQDNVDPDNMTYEELLELGEAVGTQSRGLSQDQIALLPTSKFKCSFFSRKKFRGERCVICQMEYKRGDRRMSLPCKHLYHTGCGSRWLNINKACPICYKEVIVEVPKH